MIMSDNRIDICALFGAIDLLMANQFNAYGCIWLNSKIYANDVSLAFLILNCRCLKISVICTFVFIAKLVQKFNYTLILTKSLIEKNKENLLLKFRAKFTL